MENNKLSFPKIYVSYKDKDASKRVRISSSADAYRVLQEIYTDCMQHHEECWIMYLNRANKLLGITNLSKGGIHGTVVDVRIIIQTALLSHASGIILSHNHPSGEKRMSGEDIAFTKRVKNACDMLDIDLIDHIILSDSGYTSYSDEGL